VARREVGPARSRRNRGYQVGPAGGYLGGDRVAYVTAVYEAAIIDGSPAVRDDELSDVAWFAPAQLAELELSRFARALLAATGYL
jgi:8-oxo-dGTP pyrophosphatase MutT (NUDIX family)